MTILNAVLWRRMGWLLAGEEMEISMGPVVGGASLGLQGRKGIDRVTGQPQPVQPPPNSCSFFLWTSSLSSLQLRCLSPSKPGPPPTAESWALA